MIEIKKNATGRTIRRKYLFFLHLNRQSRKGQVCFFEGFYPSFGAAFVKGASRPAQYRIMRRWRECELVNNIIATKGVPLCM